jgi:hypothetical protein
MKVRIGLAGLATGALAFGLLVAPGAATAAPTDVTISAEKPSGKALVRVYKGTAMTKEVSKGTYRITVPVDAQIGWLGEVQGKGTRIGSFTPKALVAGWARLGHSDTGRTTATLAWTRKGADKPVMLLSSITKPQINSGGKLVFTAKIDGRLPKNMKDFSININRASGTPRFPIPGAIIAIVESLSYQATLTSDTAGDVTWTGSDGSRSECTEVLDFDGEGEHPIGQDIVCAGMIISGLLPDGTPSYVELVDGQVNANTAYGYVDDPSTQGASARVVPLFAFMQVLLDLTYG